MQKSLGNFVALVAVLFFVINVESASRRLPIENPNARVGTTDWFLNYRLPNSSYPEHYNITLTTNVHTGYKDFNGTVIIDIVVVEETMEIFMHARQLKGFVVNILDLSSGVSERLNYIYEPQREFLSFERINFKPFPANSKWRLTIAYKGTLRDDNGGFYLSSYVDDEGNDR